MRVAFLLPSLSPSGGTRVVLDHAAALRADGAVEAAVVVVEGTVAAGPDVPVLGVEAAAERDWDMAVGSWWTTVPALLELRSARRLMLVQGDDERAYGSGEPFDALVAAAAVHAGDGVLTVSDHLADVVEARRPGCWRRVVPVGVPKDAYRGLRRAARPAGSPLRVLVEGQPSLPGKGVAEAVRAVRAAGTPVCLTLAAIDPFGTSGLDVDEIASPSDPRAMAELYARHDLLIKLSRSEGLGLAPIEAAHVGTPSLVTPYGGHRAWLEHGRNGVLVGFDDDGAVGDWLCRLAADETLIERLGDGALRLAGEWPDVQRAAAGWARALQAARESERISGMGAGSVRTLAGRVARGRVSHAALRGTHDWQARAIEDLRAGIARRDATILERNALIAERDAKIAELNDLVGELFADRDRVVRQIEEIQDSRAYRMAVGTRETLRKVRGRSGGSA